MFFDDDERDGTTDDVNDDVNDDDTEDDDDSSSDDSDDKPGDDKDDGDFDKDRALKTIRKLRKVEKDLKDKVKEYEDKDKTEAQKAKDDLKAARKELAEARAEAAAEKIKSKAQNAGAHNPERIVSLIDLDEHDNDADAAIAALKKSDPYLFKADDSETKDPKEDADSGETGNPRRRYSGKLTIDKIRNMSPDDLQKNQAEVDRFLASQS